MGIRRVGWYEARDNIRRASRENPAVSYLSTYVNWREGFCQIWAFGECHLVTRIDQNKKKTLVVCLLAGRNLFDWGYDLIHELETLATSLGCTRITIEGRKGWERLLKPFHYSADYVSLSKDLGIAHKDRHEQQN